MQCGYHAKTSTEDATETTETGSVVASPHASNAGSRKGKGVIIRCYICDVELSEGEISLDKRLKSNPCTGCQTIIYETAFSGKFKKSYGEEETEDYSDDFEPDDKKFAEMVETDAYSTE